MCDPITSKLKSRFPNKVDAVLALLTILFVVGLVGYETKIMIMKWRNDVDSPPIVQSFRQLDQVSVSGIICSTALSPIGELDTGYLSVIGSYFQPGAIFPVSEYSVDPDLPPQSRKWFDTNMEAIRNTLNETAYRNLTRNRYRSIYLNQMHLQNDTVLQNLTQKCVSVNMKGEFQSSAKDYLLQWVVIVATPITGIGRLILYIYIYMCVCACACVCMCLRE